MLPRADLNVSRPASPVEPASRAASSTDARADVYRRLSQIAIGRELQASVDAVLDDGNFLVDVDGAAARMALPAGTQVGDKLALVFVAREPRPTFLLAQEGGSAPASLSSAGKLIDRILQAAARDGGADAVNGALPLLADGGADAGSIADALHEGLGRSGLFYESHLKDWLNGARSLAQLAQEPQARFGADQDAATGEPGNKLSDLARDARLQPANPHTTDADLLTRADALQQALDPEAARMISLQLSALEQEQLRWRGELWPGQQLEWEVGKDKPDGSTGGQDEAVWNSAVRFELPHLGSVAATIRLIGDRVHVQVDTGSEDSAAALRGHAKLLADALAAAGSQLDSLLVKRDATP